MNKPERIQLRRKKGWKMPENTVKVDRSTKYGNPFIVGKHGTRRECVIQFIYMLTNRLILAGPGPNNFTEQNLYSLHLSRYLMELKGKIWLAGVITRALVMRMYYFI